MKVAYLTTYYNGAVDGRFGRFHDWIHALRDMDDPPFEFEVVALSASNADGTLSSSPHGFLGEATDLWGSPVNDVEFALNVPRAVRDLFRTEFDVLHVPRLDKVSYPVALLFSRRSPVVGPNVQGYVPGREGEPWNRSGVGGLRNGVEFGLSRALLRAASDPTLVTLSRYHADNVRSYDANGTIEVIPPGVDAIFSPMDRRVEPSADRPTSYLYVGDLSEYKGYYLFLDALAQLRNDIDFRATVIGSGDPDRDRIRSLGLADVVTVEGFVSREDLPRFYREADVYVMPSIDENGPNTIVEALACGTPVVATDRPGINEYVPEGAGTHVERSPSGLRKGLVEAHDNREEFARNALEHAPEFTAERTVEALATLYEDHLDRVRG